MSTLGPLDAGFLELEDSDQHVSAGIGAVAILAGTPGDRADFDARLAQRVDSVPRLRQKVRRRLWDATAPIWADDPTFDLGHHLTWTALPQPCDEQALWELAAATMEHRLDRDHPLWHCTVVEHVADGRWALILCAHHSMVDGMSGISFLEQLCDPVIGESEAAIPESLTTHRTAAARWLRLIRSGAELPWQAPRLVAGTVRGTAQLVWNAAVSRGGSSLNGPIGLRRRYAVARVPMAQIRRVQTEFGGTVNDVALAAVTAAFRALLLGRGEDPHPHAVRILAPVSVRSPVADRRPDNQVSVMLPLLPVDVADPLDQLRGVRAQMDTHKSSGETGAGEILLALARIAPFAPVAWAVRVALRYPQHSVAALATNVVGPTESLRLFGNEVRDVLPYAPIAMRLRIGIAMLSYHGQLGFGITGDYDSASDIEVIARTIPAAVTRLMNCADEHRLGRPADSGDRGGSV